MFLQIALAAKKAAGGEEAGKDLADQIAGFFEYLISRVPSWIAGFTVFALTFFVAKLAKSAVETRIADRIDEEHQEILVLAGRVTYFGTLALGITIALKIAGIDLTTILAAVAFGIGFALRDLIMNFLAGVMILVSRQFTIGDFIKVGNTVGKVVEIQTRATILKAIDGTKVIVPNSEIFSNQVVSFTTNPLRRVLIPLSISYGTDVNYAMKIMLNILKKHPKILKKPLPSVIMREYGNSNIELGARFWVGSRDGWYRIRSEIMQQMLEEYGRSGLTFSYNTLHIETKTDTAEEWKESKERAEKSMEEMALSETIATQNLAIQPNGAKTEPKTGNGAASLVVATVPVEPSGAYADQEEIDGQA